MANSILTEKRTIDPWSLEGERRMERFVNAHVESNVTDLVGDLMNASAYGDLVGWDFWNFENGTYARCPKCDAEVYEEHGGVWKCPKCGCEFEDCDPEYVEPCEFWIVDAWLGAALKRHNEMIKERLAGWIWGRGGTGQAIWMDNVILDIAREHGVLNA